MFINCAYSLPKTRLACVFEWFLGETFNLFQEPRLDRRTSSKMLAMSLEELVSKLHVAGEQCGRVDAITDGIECLLLTEEQREVHRRRQCCSEEHSSEGHDKHDCDKEGTDVDDERMLVMD